MCSYNRIDSFFRFGHTSNDSMSDVAKFFTFTFRRPKVDTYVQIEHDGCTNAEGTNGTTETNWTYRDGNYNSVKSKIKVLSLHRISFGGIGLQGLSPVSKVFMCSLINAFVCVPDF